jgi:hypothetical protein
MGNIGFSAEPNIGTYGCGPCLGILLELENLYACAHLSAFEQVGTFLTMCDRLHTLGHNIKRVVAFQQDCCEPTKLQALQNAFSQTEFIQSHQAAFCHGELITEVPIPPPANLLELEYNLLATACSAPTYLKVQFKPQGLEIYDGGYQSLVEFYRDYVNPPKPPIEPPTILNARKAFIKASRK